MNTFSSMLLESVVHATGYALVGTLVYLALRRWSPAAGALAAGSSIVIMAVVSLIVLGPWPRWEVFAWNESGPTTAANRAVEKVDDTAGQRTDDGSTPPRPIGAPKGPAGARIGELASPAQSSLARFLAELSRELRPATAGPHRARWGWPEWIAVGFCVSLGLGLARLSLGIWAIRRLRARSLPIVDGDLNDEIQILRAELSCTPAIEARETPELATPATIGWRRPLLLLPGDWREWSQAERRAVLAHELAHVCRGDFLASLAAQLSLALHFYHPLAHWLVARLRLEQELAADAWGATLSGGKTTYLATLAQMALRRDGRAVTWPARAFLPSRGTFVRRIEMLRSTTRIPHASLPTAMRLLTVGVLATLGLLVAGLRGPAGWPAAQAQVAGQGPSHQSGAGNLLSAGDADYNMAYVPADAKMVLAARPRFLLQHREIRAFLGLFEAPALKGVLDAHAQEVDEVLVSWEGNAQLQPGSREPLIPPPSGVVLRMSKSQDWKTLLAQLLGPSQDVRHDGQAYYRPAARGPETWCAFAPDDRTLVLSHEDLLRELIVDRNATAPRRAWDDAWKKVAKGQLMLAFETRWLRRRIAQGMAPSGPGRPPNTALSLETISPLLDKAQSYAIGVEASRGLTLDVVAATGSEQNIKPVSDTLQALVTLAKNVVQGLKRDSFGQSMTEAMEWTAKAADSLLDQARIDASGNFVHLHAQSTSELADGIKLLAPAVTAARDATRRNQSVNNLKQIGLAFHNFAAVNEHFPATVLYGGSKKSVPHSWRVAILPFIEQNELYQQYNFDEPWDGPNNRRLIDKMPAIFSVPGLDGGPLSRSMTTYLGFTGDTAALTAVVRAGAPSGPAVADFTDGTSNTILVVEAKRDIPWTKPEDIPFDPNGPVPEIGGFWPEGFDAAFADGSVRLLKKSINPMTLKALITRAGGEVVSSDSF